MRAQTVPLLARYALLLALTGWSLPMSAQPPAKPKDAVTLHERLAGSGYTAVPLAPRDEWDHRFVTTATVRKEQLRLILDTGAGMSLIDSRAAKRCELKPIGESEAVVTTAAGELRLRRHTLTNFAIGSKSNLGGEILTGDLDALLMNARGGARHMDGLLGQPLLAEHRAVIDCGRPALYLIDPMDRVWPTLRGEWLCVAGERDGKKVPEPRKWLVAFTDKGKAVVRHKDRDGETEAAVLHHDDGGRGVLAVCSNTTGVDVPLFDQLGSLALYAVERDRLKLCYALPKPDAKFRVSARPPAKFDSTLGSGCACLEFERIGKGADAAEPLSRWLTRAGYSEVPLSRIGEQDNRFKATLTCGKQPLRMLVDTGARTLLFPITVERLGLKPHADKRMDTFTKEDDPVYPLVTMPDLGFGTVRLPTAHAEVSKLAARIAVKSDESIDGILGHDLLTHLSAVIDYEKPAIYVISPLDKEWPKLAGEWVCTSGTRDGKPLADTEHWRFHFGDKGKARITDASDGADVALGADILSFGKDRVLTLTRPRADKPARQPFEQDAIWMQYSVKGDTLKVAFLLQPKDTAVLADRVPLAVESKAGSGVVVLEFTRKPKPPEKK